MNKKILAFFTLLLMPVFAYAHSGGEHLYGFSAGFSHPFSGLDHIIAMLAVGVLARQYGGKNVYLLPLTFIIVMTLAAFLGISGVAVAQTEAMIMLSNAALIALLLISSRFSTPISMTIVGFFALFHGISHGAEMPLATETLFYMLGFITATALLHGTGLLFAGLWTKRLSERCITSAMNSVA